MSRDIREGFAAVNFFIVIFSFITLVLVHPGFAWAQEDTSGSLDGEIEDLYDRLDQADTDKAKKKADSERASKKTEKKSEIMNLGELSTLAPFSDVAVIQKRFLPKTGRFELSGTVLTGLNNPFYNNLGATVRGAYYIREKYGVELMYFYLGNTERAITTDLKKNVSIKADSLVTPKSFMGAAFKWNPIYGKITFLNNRIVPFDINFNFGGGLTDVGESKSESTLHFGTSQVFALSKGMAFRWDFTWNFYQATALVDGVKKRSSQDDLFIGLGMSFYFPEATYR